MICVKLETPDGLEMYFQLVAIDEPDVLHIVKNWNDKLGCSYISLALRSVAPDGWVASYGYRAGEMYTEYDMMYHGPGRNSAPRVDQNLAKSAKLHNMTKSAYLAYLLKLDILAGRFWLRVQPTTER